jgi:hypothetical protein
MMIPICDREADIFAYLSYKLESDQRFIVRAAQDRVLYDADGSCISDAIGHTDALGSYAVNIPQKGNRKSRVATVQLHSCNLQIASPKSELCSGLEYVNVNVVCVIEHNAPTGQKPLSWILLTNELVENFTQASQVVSYYEKR